MQLSKLKFVLLTSLFCGVFLHGHKAFGQGVPPTAEEVIGTLGSTAECAVDVAVACGSGGSSLVVKVGGQLLQGLDGIQCLKAILEGEITDPGTIASCMGAIDWAGMIPFSGCISAAVGIAQIATEVLKEALHAGVCRHERTLQACDLTCGDISSVALNVGNSGSEQQLRDQCTQRCNSTCTQNGLRRNTDGCISDCMSGARNMINIRNQCSGDPLRTSQGVLCSTEQYCSCCQSSNYGCGINATMCANRLQDVLRYKNRLGQ